MELDELKQLSYQQAIAKSLEGRIVTVVNPESYRMTPTGSYKLDVQFYKGKVKAVCADFIVLICEFVMDMKGEKKEPVQQYIPFSRVKRVSIMAKEILIHL
jgi:hypothetical protein